MSWLLDHLWPVLIGGGGASLFAFFRRRIFKWGRNEVALGYCREDLAMCQERVVEVKEWEKRRKQDCADSCDDYCAQLTGQIPSKPS